MLSVEGEGNLRNPSTDQPSISHDGRYVAFRGGASIFVHDRNTDEATRVGLGRQPSISGDGRYVAFESRTPNLVPGDTNGADDVFVHDRQTGDTMRASVDNAGNQSNDRSTYPSISADGRYVAFESRASNLVSGDTNGAADIFVHDRQTGETTRVSVSSTGEQVEYWSGEILSGSVNATISADGRYVAFDSWPSTLVSGGNPAIADVLVHDRETGETTRVSVDSAGNQGNHFSYCGAISADGHYVAFRSAASNLVPGDTNDAVDVFLHDRRTGKTTRVSDEEGCLDSADETDRLAISADGRYVAFQCAPPTAPDRSRGQWNVFVHDARSGKTTAVSVDSEGNLRWGEGRPAISGDGRYVAFASGASLVPSEDAGGHLRVYVRSQESSTDFAVPRNAALAALATGGALLIAAGVWHATRRRVKA